MQQQERDRQQVDEPGAPQREHRGQHEVDQQAASVQADSSAANSRSEVDARALRLEREELVDQRGARGHQPGEGRATSSIA